MSTSPYASHPAAAGRSKTVDSSDSVALWAVVSLLLGILVAVLGFFAMMMWVDAHNAKDAANRAAAKVSGGAATTDMPGMPGMAAGNTASAVSNLQSYAGAAPTNAAELAATSHTRRRCPRRRPVRSRTSTFASLTSPSRSLPASSTARGPGPAERRAR
jgi:hypothetical protein